MLLPVNSKMGITFFRRFLDLTLHLRKLKVSYEIFCSEKEAIRRVIQKSMQMNTLITRQRKLCKGTFITDINCSCEHSVEQTL